MKKRKPLAALGPTKDDPYTVKAEYISGIRYHRFTFLENAIEFIEEQAWRTHLVYAEIHKFISINKSKIIYTWSVDILIKMGWEKV